jgi:hypothetical protein
VCGGELLVFVYIYIYIYIYIQFFSVALQSNSGSCPPLTGPRDHTHWTHHTRPDSPGRMISSIQRPLPDNTQHSQETDVHVPGGIRTHNPSKRTAQTHPLDRAATGIGYIYIYIYICVCVHCIYIYIYIYQVFWKIIY